MNSYTVETTIIDYVLAESPIAAAREVARKLAFLENRPNVYTVCSDVMCRDMDIDTGKEYAG